MDSRSRGIYRGKKEALLGGDEELKRQIGQGKDIMSVLRTSFAIQVLEYTHDAISAVRMNLEAPESERLSEDEVVAQMSSVPLVLLYNRYKLNPSYSQHAGNRCHGYHFQCAGTHTSASG